MSSRMKKLLQNRAGLVTAVAAAGALALTAAVTLGGFTATIVNPTNTFSSGTLQLEQNVGASACYSTGTGAGGSVLAANQNSTCTIDDFGAKLDQVPAGVAAATTVVLTNKGNIAASTASLLGGACSAAAASDNAGYTGADIAGFCGKVDVTIENDTAAPKCVYPVSAVACVAPSNANTLATLNTTNLALNGIAPAATATYKVTVQLDGSATNADQGLTATQILTWALAQ